MPPTSRGGPAHWCRDGRPDQGRERPVSSRPGRTQKIAHDETPLNASSPDLRARLGWLLAMSRLHHPDPAFQDGNRFAESLGRAGFPASRSLLSRWEAGLSPISHEGMTAYERVLALEPGQITSVMGYLQAGNPKATRPRIDPASAEFADRLDELIDAAERGTALGREWQELGWHLAAVPMVHLRGSVWEALARRVVNQLPRSVNVAYRQLSTAAVSMAAIPRAQDHLVDAIATYISDPAVQVVGNPLKLLEHLPTREAARLVLEMVEKPQSLDTYQVGVWLARRKMVRGDLNAGERSQLHMLVLRSWRRDAARAGEDLAELIVDLPEGMRATLVDAAAKAGRPKRGYVVQHGEQVVASKARAFAAALAEAARAGAPQDPAYGEDRLLTRLLRESLFHRDTDRRQSAALLVSASPFASSTTDALLRRLGAGDDPTWLRARLATLTRSLCGDAHRQRLMSLVADAEEPVAVPLTEALGHLSFGATSDRQLCRSLEPEWSPRGRATLYALGMTGSSALADLSRSERAPQWQRSAARWWIEHGAVLRI